MNWVLLGGSLAGVLALTGISWILGLGRFEPLDEGTVLSESRVRLTGFDPRASFVSRDGRAALVIGDGEAALVKRHGTDMAMRRLKLPIKVEQGSDAVTVDTGEAMYGPLRLVLDENDRDRLLTLV